MIRYVKDSPIPPQIGIIVEFDFVGKFIVNGTQEEY
jgi:hypothetical protein